MEVQNIDHSSDRGKIPLALSPYCYNCPSVLFVSDTAGEGLSKEEHNYPPCSYRPDEQEHDDEVAKHHENPVDGSSQQASSHTHRIDNAEYSIPYQSVILKIQPIAPLVSLPCQAFEWYEPDPNFFVLYFKGVYTEIAIRDIGIGTYTVEVGDYALTEALTLRQAQAICHKIAWVFRDSSPVPRRGVNINGTEPDWPS